MFLDCRDTTPQRLTWCLPHSPLFALGEEDEMVLGEGVEEVEREAARRIVEVLYRQYATSDHSSLLPAFRCNEDTDSPANLLPSEQKQKGRCCL
jgi:hypothetical protein